METLIVDAGQGDWAAFLRKAGQVGYMRRNLSYEA